MPSVLEVAESVVETAWHEQDAESKHTSMQVTPQRRGLSRVLAAFKALWAPRQTSMMPRPYQPMMYATDYLARDYPDVYLMAARG